jgi:putative zinc finger/helix-turn-helix YgiT family protein
VAVPSVRRCLHCRERAVVPTTLSPYDKEMEHDGRTYSIRLFNFDVLQCKSCHSIVLTDEANVRLTDALRSAAGLLTPQEIRQNREALGYTQQQLADYLRISMYTLSRWETGAQIQQRVMDALLRLFFDVPEARSYLGASADDRHASRIRASYYKEGAAWRDALVASTAVHYGRPLRYSDLTIAALVEGEVPNKVEGDVPNNGLRLAV